jgi:class III poly(R)-hydroxyalkanoic acid synthase PhaE subunit
MADKPKGESWSKDWNALNQQFWSAWSEAARTAGTAPGKVPWHEGLEQWSRLFAPKSDAQGELVERMLAGARQFVDMAQSVSQQVTAAKAVTGAGPWSEAIAQSFGELSKLNNPMLEALRSMVGEGATSFEQLAAETHRMAEPLRHELAALLTFPTFGYTREHQERLQKLAGANAEYQEWLAKYQALMLKASQSAIGRLESKLAERSEPGREISSLRALYDLWIDAAEDGYAEVVMSDEFRHVYGSLVNAQMRVRKLVNEEIERSTQALGIPTRTELNAVHKKNAELRRRMAQLEEQLGLDPDVAREQAADAAHADGPPGRATAAKAPAPPKSKASAKRKAPAAAKAAPAPGAVESMRAVAGKAVRAAAEAAGSFAAQLAAARRQAQRKGGQ